MTVSSGNPDQDPAEHVPPPEALSFALVLDLADGGVRLWHRTGQGAWSLAGTAAPDGADFDGEMAAMRAAAAAAGHAEEPALLLLPYDQVLGRPWPADLEPTDGTTVDGWLSNACGVSAEEVVLARLSAEPGATALIAHRQTFAEARSYAESWGFQAGPVTCAEAFGYLRPDGHPPVFEPLAPTSVNAEPAGSAETAPVATAVPAERSSRGRQATLAVVAAALIAAGGLGLHLATKPDGAASDPLYAAAEPEAASLSNLSRPARLAETVFFPDAESPPSLTLELDQLAAAAALPYKPPALFRPPDIIPHTLPRSRRPVPASDKATAAIVGSAPEPVAATTAAPSAPDRGLADIKPVDAGRLSAPADLPDWPDPLPLRIVPAALAIPVEPAVVPRLETVAGSPSSAAAAPTGLAAPLEPPALPEDPAAFLLGLGTEEQEAYPAPIPTRRPTPFEAGLVKLEVPVALAPAPPERPARVPLRPVVETPPTPSTGSTAVGTAPGAARIANRRSGIDLGELALLGVFGLENKRQCLLRLPDGQVRMAHVGDLVGGWQIRAIDRNGIRLSRQGTTRRLAIAGSP